MSEHYLDYTFQKWISLNTTIFSQIPQYWRAKLEFESVQIIVDCVGQACKILKSKKLKFHCALLLLPTACNDFTNCIESELMHALHNYQIHNHTMLITSCTSINLNDEESLSSDDLCSWCAFAGSKILWCLWQVHPLLWVYYSVDAFFHLMRQILNSVQVNDSRGIFHQLNLFAFIHGCEWLEIWLDHCVA